MGARARAKDRWGQTDGLPPAASCDCAACCCDSKGRCDCSKRRCDCPPSSTSSLQRPSPPQLHQLPRPSTAQNGPGLPRRMQTNGGGRRGSQSEQGILIRGVGMQKILDQERRNAKDFDRGAARCKIFWIEAGEMQNISIEAVETQNILHSRCVSTWLCVCRLLCVCADWLCVCRLLCLCLPWFVTA
jgi:hypothetical protein